MVVSSVVKMLVRGLVFILEVIAVFVLHEIAHALAALIVGWKFEEFKILPHPPRFEFKDGRVVGFSVAPLAVRVHPRKVTERTRWQLRFIAITGPLSNGAMATGLFLGTHDAASWLVGALNVMIAVMNFKPSETEENWGNDGYLLFKTPTVAQIEERRRRDLERQL